MSKKKIRLTDKEIRSSKKKAVLKRNKSSKFLVMATALCVLMAATALFTYFYRSQNMDAVLQAAEQPDISTASVSFEVAVFNDGKARFFKYTNGNGSTIRYFVLKSSDGLIRAAFDACDVCWRAGKGYVQDGDQMVCRNCGRRFDSVRINEIKGGCNPAPLRRHVEDGKLIIQTKDILEGSGYFNLKVKA